MNLEKYPVEWHPVLRAMLFTARGTSIEKIERAEDGQVHIWLRIPWMSDINTTAWRMAEYALTEIERSK